MSRSFASKPQTILAMPRRHGLAKRLTGFLALSLLMLELLACGLISPRSVDLSQLGAGSIICSVLGANGVSEDAPSEQNAQGATQCVFCLPIFHAAPQPENASVPARFEPPESLSQFVDFSSPVLQILPPGRAAPRGPPLFT